MCESGLGLRRLRLLDGAGAELRAAAVRHPDAGLVVPPGLSEQTRRVARRSQQHDPLRRVGDATRTFTGLRRARHRRASALGRRRVLTDWRLGLRVLCSRRRREKDQQKKGSRRRDRDAHSQGPGARQVPGTRRRGSRGNSLTVNGHRAAWSPVVLVTPPIFRRISGPNGPPLAQGRLLASQGGPPALPGRQ